MSRRLATAETRLDTLQHTIETSAKRRLDTERHRLELLAQRVEAENPERLLRSCLETSAPPILQLPPLGSAAGERKVQVKSRVVGGYGILVVAMQPYRGCTCLKCTDQLVFCLAGALLALASGKAEWRQL